MKTDKTCVLAYSGGLDTSAMLPWLVERGYTVHALLVDVGQEENLPELMEKALRYGAVTAEIADAKPAIYQQIAPLAIGLNATYEGVYRLGTAIARPVIAAAQVAHAKKLGGATLVHGATGKGNDQVRFEFGYRSLAPEMPVLAPWKSWEFSGRVDLVNYIRSKGFTDNYALQKDYSLDENLWHVSIEGGPLEDPASDLDVREVLRSHADRFCAANSYGPGAASVTVGFVNGAPVSLNGDPLPLSTIFSRLNHQYRHASWAWDLVIENRFTGIKSRGLYINPAAKLLQFASDALARASLNKPTYEQYAELGRQFGTMLYRGEWFSDQRLVMEAAARVIFGHLNGTVTVKLEPTLYAAKIVSNSAIFTKSLATFEKSEYSHADAKGFIALSWLGNVGKPFVEKPHVSSMEANGLAAPNVRTAQPVPGAGLVPAAV